MKYPWYSKFVTCWVFLTAVYIVSGYITTWLHPDYNAVNLSAQFTFIVGLFVPYGFINLAEALSALLPLLFFALFVAFLFYADKIAKGMGVSRLISKIGYNVTVLFVLTIIVDFSIWGQWMSLNPLLESFGLHTDPQTLFQSFAMWL